MLDYFRLSKNRVNPIWSIQRFLPAYFLRYLKFFIIPFIKYPLSFLKTYKTFYIGLDQHLVTFLVSPKSFLCPCDTISDSMGEKILTFLRMWANMFFRFLITLFMVEFHLPPEDSLSTQCKVKNSLTLYVQPIYSFMKIHIKYHFYYHNETDSYRSWMTVLLCLLQ